jgi:branched-chain amino acid transport system substrate-binding protein
VEMFALAASKAGSNDPMKIAASLEGLKMKSVLGEIEMRGDNHQLLQPLFVSTLSDKAKNEVEGTGLGWVTDLRLEAKDTAMPTICKMERPR